MRSEVGLCIVTAWPPGLCEMLQTDVLPRKETATLSAAWIYFLSVADQTERSQILCQNYCKMHKVPLS